ncbi:hypothetical protein RGUI_4206 (plasmid) [Rhodovulum sp. P5]|uniref:putative Ig domain-containing protein n=1 Tax=Rhodovulum sp. P5 TaxID=1564506 RepID=UPI0009C2EBEE|nr:putative Ig domain-containing protein [Rhodovulum sp. P5]ARE42523.1 hypothetical protein RGUI_4206 [Rhodovulum sp. P5]
MIKIRLLSSGMAGSSVTVQAVQGPRSTDPLTVGFWGQRVPAIAAAWAAAPYRHGHTIAAADIVTSGDPGFPEVTLEAGLVVDGAAVTLPYTVSDGEVIAGVAMGTHVSGDVAETTETITVTYTPPVAAGALPDLLLTAETPVTGLDLSADFTGEGLSFELAPSSAALPAGLTLSAAGLLEGTPAAAATGQNIILRARNSGGEADSGFTVDVQESLRSVTVPTVRIAMRRSALRTAPERIFFQATVGGFDTQPAGQGEVYDPHWHDLIYVWDFGDAGATFTAPENLLDDHRDANTAFGPYVAHVYETPGSYTVTCKVYEPATGKYAETRYRIGEDDNDLAGDGAPVRDPEAVFTLPNHATLPTETWYIDDTLPEDYWVHRDDLATAQAAPGVGDGWYRVLNTLLTAKNRLPANRDKHALRIMLPRDTVHELATMQLVEAYPHLHLVAGPGNGADPVIVHTNALTGRMFELGSFGSQDGSVLQREFALYGIELRGPWDSTTETFSSVGEEYKSPAISTGYGYTDTVLVSNCTISGFEMCFMWQCSTALYPSQDPPYEARQVGGWCIHNTVATNWRDYVIFTDGARDFAFLGCRLADSPDALSGGVKHGYNAPTKTGELAFDTYEGYHNQHFVRFKACRDVVIDACDMFTNRGWSGLTDPEYRAMQPVLRWNQDGLIGARGNITRCSMEGGGGLVSAGATNHTAAGFKNNVSPQNVLFHHNVMVGSWHSAKFFTLGTGGFTIRNNLAVFPEIADRTILPAVAFVLLDADYLDKEGAKLLPVKVYHNTIVNRTPYGEPGAAPVAVHYDPAAFPQVEQAYNLLLNPDAAGKYLDDFDTATLLWTPRYQGPNYRHRMAEHVLTADVSPGGTVAIDYPPNVTQAMVNGAGYHLFTYDSNAEYGNTTHASVTDFGASQITVQNDNTAEIWQAGHVLRVYVDIGGNLLPPDSTWATPADTVALYAPTLSATDILGQVVDIEDHKVIDDLTGKERPAYLSLGALEVPD